MIKFLIVTFLLAFNFQIAKAQFVYQNEECSGAMSLPVSNSSLLQDTLYLYDGFADPAKSTIPHCTGNTNLIKNDLWYSFVATGNEITIVTKFYPMEAGIILYQLFTGTCDNLTSVSCYSNLAFNKITGLVIGQQYYLRSYYPTNAGNIYSTFNVNLVSKPINDDCVGALELPVYSAITNGSKTQRFTNELATITTNECAVNSPPAWTNMKDVWYKFTATSTKHTILIQVPPSSGAKAWVYGGSLGSLSSIASFSFTSSTKVEIKNLTNLVVGSTYYIRFGCVNSLNFNVGIYNDAPANDDCSHADTVLMSSSALCENNFTINNRLTATNSTGGCSSSATKDVWFIFKATSTDITVRGKQEAGGPNIGLLKGECGALSCLNNNGNATFSYSGLTVGNYYYLQVGGGRENNPATICISPKSTNDECVGAITLPIKPYNQIRNTIAYTDDATQSMTDCSGYNGPKDLWYKFTAIDTACIITIDGAGYFQVFEGACDNLSSLHCSGTNALPGDVTERTEKVSGLTPGAVYYLRIYSLYNAEKLTIDINALPGSDDCAGATVLQPQQGLAYEPLNNNGILFASESMPPCSATTSTNDIWYKFTATDTTAAIISNRESGDVPGTVMGFELFSGGCQSLTSIKCFSQGTYKHTAQTFTNLVAGQTYYLRQYGNFFSNRITVVKAPVNDEMSGAIKLSPSPGNAQSLISYYTHGASKRFGKICTTSTNPMNHDVWFYFIAEATSHTVAINRNNSFWPESIDGFFYTTEAFNGYAADSTALAGKLISCANNNNALSLTNLIVGDTVYLRVANSSDAGYSSIFSINVSNSQNIDEPQGALLLSSKDAYQFSITTAGATQSLPAGGCTIADFPDDDVWFKFAAATDIKRIVAGLETKDVTMQLFSGTPGNLTALQCSNNIMVLPGSLTIGNLYYLRVYSKANAQEANFSIGLFGEDELSANDCLNDINLLGPNLIENPECESDEPYLLPIISLGEGYAGKKLTKGWWSTSPATPDTWNADYPSGFGNVPDLGGFGLNKIPRSGKGMIGMLNYTQGGGWNEYVTGKLKQPLIKGKTYFVSFYINFAGENGKNAFNLGALFSNDSIHNNLNTDPFLITPQIAVNATEKVPGTNGWRNICGYVYADKSYSFITIGNFGEANLYGGGSNTYCFLDDVTVADASTMVLPLRLLDFTGRMNTQQQTELHWITASETSTKYFEVEWHTDTKPFTALGIVQASGNSTSDKTYNFLHPNPDAGNNYYRLKMFDTDGRFTYSPIVKTVISSKENNLSVYPNPVSRIVKVSATMEKDEMVYFRLVSSDGNTLGTKYKVLTQGSNLFSWDISTLAAGNYFLVSTSAALKPVHIVKY